MRVQQCDLETISRHQFLRDDCKYWRTVSDIHFKQWVYLKEIFDVIKGSVQTENYVNGVTSIPYVRIGDISYKYGISTANMICLDEESIISNEKVLRNNDIVLATIGATVGKAGVAAPVEGGTFSNNTVVLRPKENTLNVLFYEKLFQTDYFISYVFGVVSQKAQPNLQEYDLKHIKIPIIPSITANHALQQIAPIAENIAKLKKQKRTIGDIINSVFADYFMLSLNIFYTIENSKRINLNSAMSANRNSTLRFSYRWYKGQEIQNHLISAVDCCKPLGKYLCDTQNGWSPECYDSPSDYQVLGIDSITKSGKISFENVKYSDADNNNFDDYIVKNGDFFVSRGNTTDLVALASIAEVDEDDPVTIFPDLMIRLTLSDQINKRYLAYVINSFIGRLYFKYVTKGKNQTMVKVSPKELREFMLPVPSLEIQREIVEKIDEELEKQQKIEEQISDLRAQIDCIIEETIQ